MLQLSHVFHCVHWKLLMARWFLPGRHGATAVAHQSHAHHFVLLWHGLVEKAAGEHLGLDSSPQLMKLVA
jgi:hypothetical protein